MYRFLTFCLLFLCSCATSNLDSAPDWAKQKRLPTGAEFDSYRDSDRYHIFVVHGTASASPEIAYKAARQRAARAIEKDLFLGMSAAKHDWLPKDLSRHVHELTSWNGYKEDWKHSYLLCAYDKEPAIQQVERHLRGQLAGIRAGVSSGVSLKSLDQTSEAFSSAKLTLRVLTKLTSSKRAKVYESKIVAHKLEVSLAIQKEAARMASADDEDALRRAKVTLKAADLVDVSKALATIDGKLPCGTCKTRLRTTSNTAVALRRETGKMGSLSSREAASALSRMAAYRSICRHKCYYYQVRARKAGLLQVRDQLTGHERKAISRIAQLGDRLATSNSVSDREKALTIYQTGARFSGRTFGTRILKLKRNLPCRSCNTNKAGICVSCSGQRGRTVLCQQCSGNTRYKGRCNSCRGDGKKNCSSCGADGKVSYRCNSCSKGKVRCNGGCRGGVEYGMCGRCFGSGAVTVFVGVQMQKRRCSGCGGRGKNRLRCSTCRGSGRIACRSCRGTARKTRTCSTCRGSARSGKCSKCEGNRQIFYPCTKCREGKVWSKCSRCNGVGKCSTCKGSGHRR